MPTHASQSIIYLSGLLACHQNTPHALLLFLFLLYLLSLPAFSARPSLIRPPTHRRCLVQATFHHPYTLTYLTHRSSPKYRPVPTTLEYPSKDPCIIPCQARVGNWKPHSHDWAAFPSILAHLLILHPIRISFTFFSSSSVSTPAIPLFNLSRLSQIRDLSSLPFNSSVRLGFLTFSQTSSLSISQTPKFTPVQLSSSQQSTLTRLTYTRLSQLIGPIPIRYIRFYLLSTE